MSWSKMRAPVAAAMVLIVVGNAVEALAAKPILVQPSIRIESTALFDATPQSEGCPVYECGAHPNSSETGPCRPDVIFHLPARTEPEFLIRGTDDLYHIPADGEAEVSQ
jgi:hypothetical protein